MSKDDRVTITTTRFMRIWHKHRRRDKEHDARVAAKNSQIEMAEALKESHTSAGNTAEVKRLVLRLRLLRQELKYMKK